MRVVVLGGGAAGKSTFAHELGQRTGIEVVELDSVFWSDELTPMTAAQWTVTQRKLTAGDAWILDGDLGPHDAIEVRLERADTVVLFDVAAPTRVWRALRRSRENWGFWTWMLTWRRREKPRLLAAIELHAPAAVVHVVRSNRDAASLIDDWPV